MSKVILIAGCEETKSGDLILSRNGQLPLLGKGYGVADMNFFRKTTMGGIVIMGRKTWDTLPSHLKGRLNVIVSSSPSDTFLSEDDYLNPEIKHLYNLKKESVKSTIDEFRRSGKDIYIIGGASIYELFRDTIEYIYLNTNTNTSKVPKVIEGERVLYFDKTLLEGAYLMEENILSDKIKCSVYATKNHVLAGLDAIDTTKHMLNVFGVAVSSKA